MPYQFAGSGFHPTTRVSIDPLITRSIMLKQDSWKRAGKGSSVNHLSHLKKKKDLTMGHLSPPWCRSYTASACSIRCCVMYWEVLHIPAGRGGSGQPHSEHGLPKGINEAHPFFCSGWPHTSFQPIKAGWAPWLWLPTAGESWCYPPPWEPGRHPHTHPQI